MTEAAPSHPSSVISRQEAQVLEVSAWDHIAHQRASDLDADRDPSFRYVLAPGITSLVPTRAKNVLDIGCGVGRFTRRLADLAENVVGIDPSAVSAELSKQYLRKFQNVRILNLSIREYAGMVVDTHDAAVALMVLQDITDLDDFLKHSSTVLKKGAPLVGAITHPHNWPKYWGYNKAPWFKYDRELFIRSTFRTSLTTTPISTLHVHRPIRMYRRAFAAAGFERVDAWAPMMDSQAQRQAGVSWRSPHFWFFRTTRS